MHRTTITLTSNHPAWVVGVVFIINTILLAGYAVFWLGLLVMSLLGLAVLTDRLPQFTAALNWLHTINWF